MKTSLFPQRVSSQLMSQTMSRDVVDRALERLGRKTYDYSPHRLRIEAWAVGVWVAGPGVRGCLISYKDIAETLRLMAAEKAFQLPVERRGDRLYLVGSLQKAGKHAVLQVGQHWACDCMKFRCWNNRMRSECPPLFEALNKQIFCHHIVAASD